MNGQDYDVTAIANDDRSLEEEVARITGIDNNIGPVEGQLEKTFVTLPSVIAVLTRWRTNHSVGPVTHNDDEIDGTPTPAPHAAADKEISVEYLLHILMPEQRCEIKGRPEVRFFYQRGSAQSTSEPATSGPATAKVRIFEQRITLRSINQPEASVAVTSTADASVPKLPTLEPPLTVPQSEFPSNPANTDAFGEHGNT